MSSFSKIGPQILSQEMMKLVFPYEKEVLDNIEQIRDVAQKDGCAFREMLHVDEKKALMVAKGYSNAISILGSRGSGKTSIIMTLRDKLQKKNGDEKSPQRNIIMPFLAPQDFAEEEPLLGWVVSHLLKLGEKTVKEIKDGNQKDTYPSRRTGYRQRSYEDSVGEDISEYMTQLLEAFRLRSENAIGGHSLQFPERDQVYYYIDSVKQDAELQCIMLKLISEIVSYHRDRLQRNGEKTNSDGGNTASATEPLIILPIDDLDLTPNRSNEVLELVLRYLQHPNVVILCGWNYELFLNHLSIELLKQQGVLSEDMLNTNFTFNDVFMTRYRKQTTALITARRLALDSLKKAFPPAQRYEIRGLTLSQRADFMLNEENDKEEGKEDTVEGKKGETLFNTIVAAIRSCVHNSDSNAKKNATQFLFDGNGNRLIVYTRIFDNKARGLINVHRAFASLMEGQDALKPKADSEWDITDAIRSLFDTILFSNSRFAPYRRGIRDLVQIKRVYAVNIVSKENDRINREDRRQWRLEYFCDYEALFRMYEEYSSKKANIRADILNSFEADRVIEQEYDYFPSVLIDIFLLLNFMENLLHSVTQTGVSTHGGEEFSKLLNAIYPPIRFAMQPQDNLIRAIEMSGVEELKLFPHTSIFATNAAILNKYEEYDFGAQRYHFTGFRSLEKIFDLVQALVAESKRQDDTKDMNAEKIEKSKRQDDNKFLNVEKAKVILREDSEWLKTIMMLFRDLYPIKENAMRYGIYISLLNSLNGEQNEARTRASLLLNEWSSARNEGATINAINEQLGLNCNSMGISKDNKLTDEQLYEVVRWLRTMDRNRQRLLPTIRRTRPKEVRVNLNKRGVELQNYARAMAYIKWGKNRKKLSTIDKNYPTLKKTFQPIIDYKYVEPVLDEELTPETLFEVVSNAKSVADRVVEYLLRVLKAQLLSHVQDNYYEKKATGSTDGLKEYLAHASMAVWEYIERWELAPGSWGMDENDACDKMIAIFIRNFMQDRVADVRKIQSMGKDLKSTGRDRYNDAVAVLHNWVLSNGSYFDDSEITLLREALRILADAPNQIRRDLPVEDEIYKTIMEVGERIAFQCGLLCQEHFKLDEKTADDQIKIWPLNPASCEPSSSEAERMKYWPISTRYDKRMTELRTTFMPLLPQKTRSQGSMFDVDYDDFAFYRKKNW